VDGTAAAGGRESSGAKTSTHGCIESLYENTEKRKSDRMVAADDGDIGRRSCRGAPAKTADRTRPCRNQQLYARYHWSPTPGDGRGWAKLFTPDGNIPEGGSNKARGGAATELGLKAFGQAPRVKDCVLSQTSGSSLAGRRAAAPTLSVSRPRTGQPASVTVAVYET